MCKKAEAAKAIIEADKAHAAAGELASVIDRRGTFMANWFMLGSLVLLAAAIATKIARGKLTLASFLVFALWVGSAIVA